MPTWLVNLAESIVSELLSNLNIVAEAKAALANIILAIDAKVQADVAAQTGVFAAVEKEVAVAFDAAAQAIAASLKAS